MLERKQISGCLVILFVVMMVLGNVNPAVASRRNVINPRIENIITHRRVTFNDNSFNLYVNKNEKVISIHGEVEDWKEVDKAEEHFKAIVPSEYELICVIKLGY